MRSHEHNIYLAQSKPSLGAGVIILTNHGEDRLPGSAGLSSSDFHSITQPPKLDFSIFF